MPTELHPQAPLTTGRRVHLGLAQALRSRDPDAGAGREPPGPVRECLIRAARSDAYRALLIHGCQVEDAFDLYGYYTGVIDAWYECGPGVAVVVDWKTGELDPEMHHVQRVIYALALLCHYETAHVTTVNVGPRSWSDTTETFHRGTTGLSRRELANYCDVPG
jgi:hypothetical protein